MSDLVSVLAGFALTAALVAACCAWAAVHALRVRNRVAPGVRTPAPVWWLWSPRAAARLHRRLRRTILATRACLGPGGRRAAWPVLAELAAEIEARAVELDRQLVMADRTALPARSRLVHGLRDEVAEVEALNQRLVSLSAAGRPAAAGLDAVRDRLDALDAALRELVPPAQHPAV